MNIIFLDFTKNWLPTLHQQIVTNITLWTGYQHCTKNWLTTLHQKTGYLFLYLFFSAFLFKYIRLLFLIIILTILKTFCGHFFDLTQTSSMYEVLFNPEDRSLPPSLHALDVLTEGEQIWVLYLLYFAEGCIAYRASSFLDF